MTWQGAELLAVVLTVAVTAPMILLYVIPNSSRSVYRYDLWRIHDDIIDDVRAGRLPRDAEAVQHLMLSSRAAIEAAKSISVPTLLAIYLSLRDRLPKVQSPSHAELRPAERKIVHSYEERIINTTVKYLLLQRPSGLVAMMVLPLAAAIDAWRRRRNAKLNRPSRLMARPVRFEMVDDDVFARIMNFEDRAAAGV